MSPMDRSQLFFILAFFLALVSTIGSLAASEVFLFAPCTLCWYQRIFMFPLAIILPIGIIKKDLLLPLYVLPFSVLGASIALYHYLLQMKILPDLSACTFSIPCTSVDISWFGVITLPLLSFFAFLTITVCMFLERSTILGKKVK